MKEISVDGKSYLRICVRTSVLNEKDDMKLVVMRYAAPLLNRGDIVFISEKALACTQNRAVKIKDVHPRALARFLSKHVYKSPYGIGLSMPETMEMAIRECGTLRILIASFTSVVGKLIGKRGWFYIVAGARASGIDGPCEYTLPPYNECVVLAPYKPDKVAHDIAKSIGAPVVIVDINDLGGEIIGVSDNELNKKILAQILADNPLGQSKQQTPIGIIRQIE